MPTWWRARNGFRSRWQSETVLLRSDAVRFYSLQPDEVRVELVAAWKKETRSVALRAFLDLIDAKASQIRKKAEIH
jgi:hypothetical protein